MIRLYYSNHLEELVSELVKTSAASKQFWDEPTHVIVPNKNISTYLKLQIARRTGIAADIQTTYLNHFLKSQLKRDVKILDRAVLQNFIFDVLSDSEFLAQEEMQNVVRYFSSAGVAQTQNRTFQLSVKLAALFEEYALNRKQLIDHWAKETIIDDNILGENEIWQRAIWNEIFSKHGRLEGAEEQTQTKWIRSPEVFSKEAYFNADNIPDEIHFFAFSYVALSYYKMLSELSPFSNIYIYALNPCMEYWEDLSGFKPTLTKADTRFQKRASEDTRLIFGATQAPQNADPKALQAWGRPGRDHIHLLNMLTDCDFESAFVDPRDAGTSLLREFQRDILVRKDTRTNTPTLLADDSITVLAAPSIQREIETVADEIWKLVHAAKANGETLNFHDILVIVNQEEKDRYQSRIASIFKGTHNIPHNVADLNGKNHRRFLEGVELLLKLPTSNFERRTMLSLLTHPNILAKTPKVDRDLWIYWCDALSVFHGGDASDHQQTYIEKDLYHWDQAMRRLTIGAFMTEDDNAYLCDEGRFLPTEVKGSDLHDAAELSNTVRTLIGHARTLAKKSQSIAAWANDFREYIETFLVPEDDEDEYSENWCWERLQKMESSDICKTPVTYEIALQYFQNDLDLMMVSRGHYLTDGVVISSFLPMRPIPFKVIFLTGMGDHQFPHRDPKNVIDLRWAPAFRPVRGDTVSPRARDEYMFLETLVSTREKIVLSYVAQNQNTGELQQPSALIRQLEFILGSDYLQDGQTISRDIDKWRHETFSKQSYLPEVPFEKHALKIQGILSENAPYGKRAPTTEDLSTSLATQVSDSLNAFLKLPIREDEHKSLAGKISIPLSMIKRFLETPLQAAAEFHLGLWNEREHDPFDVEDELFELTRSGRRKVLKKILHEYQQQPDRDLDRLIDEICGLDSLRGTFPSGPFYTGEIRRIKTVANQWMENLVQLNTSIDELEKYNFGSANLDPMDLGAFNILGESVEIEIVGETELLSLAKMKAISFRPLNYRPNRTASWVLNGFLDLILLSAAGKTPQTEFWEIIINTAKDANPWSNVERIVPISQADAREYLSDLVVDLIESKAPYLLPAEAVFENIRSHIPLSEAIENIVSYPFSACHFGPVKEVDKFSTPPNRSQVCRRRLGLFFDSEYRAPDDLGGRK